MLDVQGLARDRGFMGDNNILETKMKEREMKGWIGDQPTLISGILCVISQSYDVAIHSSNNSRILKRENNKIGNDHKLSLYNLLLWNGLVHRLRKSFSFHVLHHFTVYHLAPKDSGRSHIGLLVAVSY